MKAMVLTQIGPPEGLQLREVEKPAPTGNQVLIRIHATTVTAGDAKLRKLTGFLRFVFALFFGLRRGKILGHELAGQVEEVGTEVTRFAAGDQIFGSTGTRSGAYAEYICLSEDRMLAHKPANMTYEEAAAVPIGANTALHILRRANIRPGQSVLVYGASGSIGTYAVQLAKHWGATVTGVCSTSNLDLVRSLGADRVIDYTREDFTQSGETYDVVFDAVIKTSASRCKAVLKENGTFLSASMSTHESVENLLFLKELIEAGELRAVIDRRYLLEQVAEAHRHVDTGHKKGNVVITVAEA